MSLDQAASSDGLRRPDQRAWMHSVMKVQAHLLLLRQVSTVVRTRSTKRQPFSVSLPKHTRLSMTNRRRARSAALFVGSTSELETKVHNSLNFASSRLQLR